jgi:glycosyltransferase involved in cell wall biosynthesis
VKRKGFHRVISCLPEIKKRVPGVMYLAVGGGSVEGNYEPELRKLVREFALEDDVVFAGQQDHKELYKWLSAADVFCLATSNEGWANVFLEAMACGLPVVTTRVGGNAEAVPEGSCGLFFILENSSEMKEALIEALQRDWDRAGIMEYARRTPGSRG